MSDDLWIYSFLWDLTLTVLTETRSTLGPSSRMKDFQVIEDV